MKTKKVWIKEKEYILKVGFGVMMQYEEENNKPITSIKKTKEIIDLLYITLKYNNEDFDYSYKDFVDNIVDEQPELITTLTELLFKNEPVEEESKKK